MGLLKTSNQPSLNIWLLPCSCLFLLMSHRKSTGTMSTLCGPLAGIFRSFQTRLETVVRKTKKWQVVVRFFDRNISLANAASSGEMIVSYVVITSVADSVILLVYWSTMSTCSLKSASPYCAMVCQHLVQHLPEPILHQSIMAQR